MIEDTNPTVAVADLRVGMYVHLDLGWMDHPFPFGSFKITSPKQIETIRSLGLQHLRYSPDKSDAPAQEPAAQDVSAASADTSKPPSAEETERLQRRALLEAQRRSQQECERQFNQATRAYRQITNTLNDQPEAAREQAATLVDTMLGRLLSQGESVVRLLSESMGDRASLHGVNVTVLSLLLGQEMKLPSDTLQVLGMAALLHDMGKNQLSDQVRFRDSQFTAVQNKAYQEHVTHSVTLGRKMGLSPATLLAISQHHEMADGSGFPMGRKLDQISPAARILALTNRYDGLCNPSNPVHALTPHEALSHIFAQLKPRFDSTSLNAFIRMMGIYPPGCIVQLSDQRYAMVTSVNTVRPLRPRVLVHDSRLDREQSVWLDLETAPELSILRSVRPLQLPKAALEYLSPRQRVCYFFERAVEVSTGLETNP